MKEEEFTLFKNIVGLSPESRILDFLIEMKEFDYNKKEIKTNSNVPTTVFNKVWQKFLGLKVIVPIKIYKKQWLFSINKDHKAIKKLIEFDHELVIEELEKMGGK